LAPIRLTKTVAPLTTGEPADDQPKMERNTTSNDTEQNDRTCYDCGTADAANHITEDSIVLAGEYICDDCLDDLSLFGGGNR
jgi:superfamily II helicase